jgi:hypothetical protein
MTRHWAPLDGPQRLMMRVRATRDGRARSAVDLELPLMGLLAILVGIGVVVWLNGQSTGGGEIKRVTERPQLENPRQALAAGAERRALEAAADRARARRVRAARALARKRAAAASLAQRSFSGSGSQFRNGTDSGTRYGDSTPGYSTNTQTYTQQTQSQAPASTPSPAPKPRPKPTGGGGGGGSFDDSG